MSYGSDDDNNNNETPKRTNNSTEINTLTKFIQRPKNYFSDPIINFEELKKSSFLQIENLFINDVKQW